EGVSRGKAQAGGRGRRVELAESLAGAQAGRGEAGTAAPGQAAGGEGCSAHAGTLPGAQARGAGGGARPFKKSHPLQYRTPKAKFEFIAEHRVRYAVAFLCRRYQVSRSGFYAWLGRDGSKRLRNDQALGTRIERIHRDSGERYGSPRVHEVLRREGLRCSNKRVARLMRERGLRARVSRLYRNSSGVHKFFLKTG